MIPDATVTVQYDSVDDEIRVACILIVLNYPGVPKPTGYTCHGELCGHVTMGWSFYDWTGNEGWAHMIDDPTLLAMLNQYWDAQTVRARNSELVDTMNRAGLRSLIVPPDDLPVPLWDKLREVYEDFVPV